MMHPSQGKRREENQEKPKSDQDNAAPSEDGLTYGIYRMSLVETTNYPEIDSKLIPAQCREGQMANKNYKNNSSKRECNILSNF